MKNIFFYVVEFFQHHFLFSDPLSKCVDVLEFALIEGDNTNISDG